MRTTRESEPRTEPPNTEPRNTERPDPEPRNTEPPNPELRSTEPASTQPPSTQPPSTEPPQAGAAQPEQPPRQARPGAQLADAAARAFRDWRAGDDAALDRLVRDLTPMLWHLARAYRVDTAAAEDAVQATWLSLVRSADRIEQPQAVLRWLSVTVQREAARASRNAARAQPTEPEEMPDDVPVHGPEQVVLARSQSNVLWRHVAELSERCQRLLRVIAFSDRPDYAELSRELGMPIGSIGPTRARCLAKLRQALSRDPAWSES